MRNFIVILLLLSVSSVAAQVVTNSLPICHVNGNPNSISSLNTQNQFRECAVAKDTVTGNLYVYNAALSVGSRWVLQTSGITSLGEQTGATQTFATGTSGTNFNISSAGNTHTFNIPDASATARGLVSTGTQTIEGSKIFLQPLLVPSGGGSSNSVRPLGNSGIGFHFSGDTSFVIAASGAARLQVFPSGRIRLHNYGSTGFTGTATKWLAVDSNGNIIQEDAPTVGGGGTVTSISMGLGLASTQSPLTTSGTIRVDTADASILSRQRAANTYLGRGLTSANIFVGNSSNIATGVSMSGDATLANTGAITIANNAVTDGKLRQSAAYSVIGRSANTTGNVADISAGTDHNILRRSGTTLGFGSIDLSQSGAVGTSRLAYSNIAQGSERSVLGVAGSSAANVASIQGSAAQVLRVNNVGTDLAFGSLDLSQSPTVGTSVLNVLNGGTGAATLTGVMFGNGTGAVTALSSNTAQQLLRRNAANNGYEFWTPTFLTTEVDGSVTNEAQSLTAAGTTTPSISVNAISGVGGGTITFGSDGIVTLDRSGNTITIGAEENPQVLTHASDATSHTVTLSESGGSLKLIEGSNITLTTTNTNEVTIASAGGGTPAGSNTQIQYNNAGAFGASGGFTFNSTDTSITISTIKISNGLTDKISNVGIGNVALNAITSGSSNTALGYNAGGGITSGGSNTIIGRGAGQSITTGSQNVAVGSQALETLTTQSGNTAIGQSALRVSTGATNTAVGQNTLGLNTSGYSNTAVGQGALSGNTTGIRNNAFGVDAFQTLTSGSDNIAIGFDAAQKRVGGSNLTSATNSVFIGNLTLPADNGQTNQIIIGYNAEGLGDSTAVIGRAMKKVRLGNNYVFKTNQTLGSGDDGKVLTYVHSSGEFQAVIPSGGGGTPAGSNTQVQYNNAGAFGANATFAYSTTDSMLVLNQNLRIGRGRYAPAKNTIVIGNNAYTTNQGIAQGNVSIGDSTMFSITTGINNNALGYSSLRSLTSGSNNNATGMRSLSNNTSGSNNTAMGQLSMYKNTTASSNTAYGYQSMYWNATGSNNTAIGTQSLFNMVGSGNGFNVAVGSGAGLNLLTATNNVAVGSNALVGAASSTSDGNVAVGLNVLQNVTNSNNNTAVGRAALNALTDGNANVAIGLQAGRYYNQDDVDYVNTTPDSCIYIGPFTKAAVWGTNTNEIVIGANIHGLGSNSIAIGNHWNTNLARIGGLTFKTTKPVSADNGKVLTYNHSLQQIELTTASGGGITSLNGLTNTTQTFATGTSGTNFNISSTGSTHTFNIPDAGSGVTRGLITNGTQSIFGQKHFRNNITLGEVSEENGQIGLTVPSNGALVTLSAPDAASSWTMILPTSAGSNGQVLTTNGSGVTSWTTVSGGSGGVVPPGTESISSSATTNATAGQILQIDCSGGTKTVNPPSSPSINTRFAVVDSKAAAGTNSITVDFDTANQKLYGVEQNYIINVNGGYVEFIYMGSTTGWIATKG